MKSEGYGDSCMVQFEHKNNISVCMATYNGEKYILEQLTSILSQLSELDELIISDDGSSDDTTHIIKSIKDTRITLLEGNRFNNPIANFQNALFHAKFKYIFLSDQDDVWIKNKALYMCEALQSHDLVMSDCIIVSEDLQVIEPTFFKLIRSGPGLLKNLRKNSYSGCCMAFDRKILKLAMPFPRDIPMHDIWIGFVADMFFKPLFLTNPLLLFRRHGNNLSSSGKGSLYSLKQKVFFRWNILKYIPLLMYRRYLKR